MSLSGLTYNPFPNQPDLSQATSYAPFAAVMGANAAADQQGIASGNDALQNAVGGYLQQFGGDQGYMNHIARMQNQLFQYQLAQQYAQTNAALAAQQAQAQSTFNQNVLANLVQAANAGATGQQVQPLLNASLAAGGFPDNSGALGAFQNLFPSMTGQSPVYGASAPTFDPTTAAALIHYIQQAGGKDATPQQVLAEIQKDPQGNALLAAYATNPAAFAAEINKLSPYVTGTATSSGAAQTMANLSLNPLHNPLAAIPDYKLAQYASKLGSGLVRKLPGQSEFTELPNIFRTGKANAGVNPSLMRRLLGRFGSQAASDAAAPAAAADATGGLDAVAAAQAPPELPGLPAAPVRPALPGAGQSMLEPPSQVYSGGPIEAPGAVQTPMQAMLGAEQQGPGAVQDLLNHPTMADTPMARMLASEQFGGPGVQGALNNPALLGGGLEDQAVLQAGDQATGAMGKLTGLVGSGARTTGLDLGAEAGAGLAGSEAPAALGGLGALGARLGLTGATDAAAGAGADFIPLVGQALLASQLANLGAQATQSWNGRSWWQNAIHDTLAGVGAPAGMVNSGINSFVSNPLGALGALFTH